MLTYCYTLTPDTNGTDLIEFPDLPEAAAVSETPDDVQANAAAGLETALQMYVDARRPIPLPSAVADGSVTLGALATAKALLSNEMVAQGVRKADMARRLGVHMPQVDLAARCIPRIQDRGCRGRLSAAWPTSGCVGRVNGCGGRVRACDLQDMNPARFRCATPRKLARS